jgi:acetoin utilization deacetylase AcuC-like enzyme
MLGFCSSAQFVDHDTGPHHPERPDRIRAVHKAVRDVGLVHSSNPFPDFHLDLGLSPLKNAKPLIELEPIAASEQALLAVHSREHIEHVREACAAGTILDQGDTPVEPRSFATALLSAGAGLVCCDAVMSGRVRRAFVAGRPPGHHAEPDRAMGFCLFSNVAIAARYLQKKHGVERVAIVDFDVHHGNGTQAAFYSDPSVLFISLHQDPATCYPGPGYEDEIGTGAGAGYTMNIPMHPGGENRAYIEAMERRVVPKLDAFRPQVLLLSAGFDAHKDDRLAQMKLDEDGFESITRSLVAVADHHCSGRVVSILEGGYNLRALGRSVVRHLAGLQEGT